MKDATKAKISATLKAYWTPERRKAHGVLTRKAIKDRMWERAYWTAIYCGREMSEWPHPPYDQPPAYTPETREWLNHLEHKHQNLEQWRKRVAS